VAASAPAFHEWGGVAYAVGADVCTVDGCVVVRVFDINPPIVVFVDSTVALFAISNCRGNDLILWGVYSETLFSIKGYATGLGAAFSLHPNVISIKNIITIAPTLFIIRN
jgi:hypothetical protein